MMFEYNTHIKFILTMLLWFIVGGCASTPNVPFQGPYPDSFAILAQKNPLLREELAKLPELQNGISDTEAAALETIVAIYINDPVVFDKAFDQMYQIGIPKIRKYCSPLQALFWIAEDNDDNNIIKNVITDFSLRSLLDKSWNLYDSSTFSENQIKGILNGIKNEDMKIDYIARRKRLSSGMYNLELIEGSGSFYKLRQARNPLIL